MNSTAQPSVHATWGSSPLELLSSELLPSELPPVELPLDVLDSTDVLSLPVSVASLAQVLLLSSGPVDDDALVVCAPELELEPDEPDDSAPGAVLDPPQPITMLTQTRPDKRMRG